MNASRFVRSPVLIGAIAVAGTALVIAALSRHADGGVAQSAADPRAAALAPATLAAAQSAATRPAADRVSTRSVASPAATAIARLREEAHGDVIVAEDRGTLGKSVVRVARGGDLYPGAPQMMRPADKVAAFLAKHGALFGMTDAARQVKLVDARRDQYGATRVTYQQMHGGLPVFAGVLRGHVSADGRLTAVNGKFVPQVGVPTQPRVARSDATRTAVTAVGAQQPAARKNADLTVAS